MKYDTSEKLIDEVFRKLYNNLSASMPQPRGDLHPYSTGRMKANFSFRKTKTGYVIELSKDVPYSSFAMGYNEAGGRLRPRGIHEQANFQTIPRCIREITNFIKENT